MKPIGSLMREHRLIERMVGLMNRELNQLKNQGEADRLFIQHAVDFFRTYADRTHHGKEEDILFKALNEKQLSAEHRKIMDELVNEHVYARKTVTSLSEMNERYELDNSEVVLGEIIKSLEKLVKLYPEHIEKEDKHFFYPILDYFTREEQDEMLQEFWDFDRMMIHEKYQKLVERLEK
ncbi:MAG TPA: cation-binding protein [Dehalococcoidia bacterium]|nr:cation-binding protein [Dehalococcoidia bacterium]